MGRDLLCAVWASVKWVLKLGHVWSAEVLVFHCLTYLAKMPELVMIIFANADELGVCFRGTLVLGHFGILADGVEDIGGGINVDVDVFNSLLEGFVESLVVDFSVGVE